MSISNVNGSELKAGDNVMIEGYEWTIDEIALEIMGNGIERYAARCHWSKNGVDPKFFNENFATARRVDLPWAKVV